MLQDAILYPNGWRWNKVQPTYAIDPAIAAWRPDVVEALSRWAETCGLEFSETAQFDTADIQLTTLKALGAPPNALAWSVIWTDDGSAAITRGFVGLPLAPPSDASWMVLHELGHVLGLSHPFQEQLGLTGDHSLTVMSYISASGDAMPERPAPLDVAAMQALYGPDRLIDAQGFGESGAGYDRMRGSAGADTLYGHAGGDSISGQEGADMLYGGADNDVLYGGQGADLLFGNAGEDTLFGDPGADTLMGGRDNDLLDGRDGNDYLFGDAGIDTLIGGAGADRFALIPGTGYDHVVDFNAAEGDRVLLPHGAKYSVIRTVVGEAVIVANGDMLVLDGVPAESVLPDWIVRF